jgi:hypothetical protein
LTKATESYIAGNFFFIIQNADPRFLTLGYSKIAFLKVK